MSRPPRLAEFLLRLVLRDRDLCDGILGDLEEDFRRQPRQRRRYWKAVLWLAARGSVASYKRPRIGLASHTAQLRNNLIESTVKDLRFAVRSLRRRPLFATVAVLTLGLGIGAATAMFSVVDRVLLQSVQFREPRQLFNVWQTAEGARGAPGLVGQTWNRLPISFEQYRGLQAESTTFESVAVHNAIQATLTGEGDPDRLWIGYGSTSLLTVLGVQPVRGRWFLPGEEGPTAVGAEAVVVISYETWKNRLGGDPEVLQRKLTLDGSDYSIVGVLPPSFRLRYLGMHWLGEDPNGRRDVWVPLGTAGLRDGPSLEAIARLAPDATVQQALTETTRILSATQLFGEVRLVPRAQDETRGLNSPLLLLFGATGLLLLIACGNIATLSLGELHGRRFELTTRCALGAGRLRIARHLLTESVLLGILGSLIGAVLAIGGTEILVAVAPPLPRVNTVGVDIRVLLFAAVLGTLTGLVFGTVPAIASIRNTASAAMGRPNLAGSVERGRIERFVVSSEIALTVVLLVAGGLLGRSLSKLLSVEPGFESEGLATIHITLPGSDYSNPEAAAAAYTQLVANIEGLPGVLCATAATRLPFPGSTHAIRHWVVGRDEASAEINAQQVVVLPGYHEAMNIPLLAGRTFNDSDGPDAPPVMLISENVARRYWPDESPLGAQMYGWAGRETGITIIGIVGDVKRNRLGGEADQVFYSTLLQRPHSDLRLVARTRGEPTAILAGMRGVVRSFDKTVPVTQPNTMDALISQSASGDRYRTLLMVVFGGLACLLAAVGVFGVAARAVALRAREYGIRIALGAESRGLMRKVLRASLITGIVGTGAGLFIAVWVTRLMSRFLFGVLTWDPFTYGVVAALLVSVCAWASYIPARRVTKVDPAEVLRTE